MFQKPLNNQNSCFIALIYNSCGLDFDKNPVNIFDKVVCLPYSRLGSVIEKIYPTSCSDLHKFPLSIQISFLH